MTVAKYSPPLRFTDDLLTRPPLSGIDVLASLEHFAIVSYAVDPARVRPLIPPRFEVDCLVDSPDGRRALVSMVPFEDQDFRFAAAPWIQLRFGQTNYRTYATDRETGERVVWFFGTTLDSWSVAIPRYAWRMPWHRGRKRFDCQFDPANGRYSRYRMTTISKWAPVELELEDSGQPVRELAGMADLEAGLVALTHPLVGVYARRGGGIGTYRVWHDRLQCNAGRCVRARIGLFHRLGLVPIADQQAPHSVLIQQRTEFAIYLPPRRLHCRGTHENARVP